MHRITGTLRAAAGAGAWALERGAEALRAVAGASGGTETAPAPPAHEQPGPQRSQQPKDVDDVTIARKVESIIFRPRGRPKSTVDVNVVDGVVWLRGTARSPEMIRRLEAEARGVPEVRDVHNLIHLPNTPAPTRTDTPASQRKTRRQASSPPRPRREPRRVNADKTVAQGEPLPEELAAQRRGRPAAPLGSQGGGSTDGGDGGAESSAGSAGGGPSAA